MRRLLPLLPGLIAVLLWAQSPVASPANTASSAALYAEGVAAFQAGDYPRALRAFLRARALGYKNQRLAYSLGATYYRLGRYASAQREFERLLRDKSLAALCHYNLGLIAAARGERTDALREFRAAYAEASQTQIRRLAAEQVARFTPPTRGLPRRFGYANLALGYDDNVALASSAAPLPPSGRGSPVVTLLAGGASQLAGEYDNGLRLLGSYYSAEYPRLSLYDEALLNLGAEYRHALRAGSLRAGLSASDVTLGGADFETLGTLQLEAGRVLDAGNRLTAGYQYQHISGAGAYQYLTGWEQQVYIEEEIRALAYMLYLGYRHAVNSREDLSVGTTFLSASPVRDRLFAELRWRSTQRLSWQWELAYETNRYRRPDALASGVGTETVTRRDSLALARIAAVYRLTPHWRLGAEYRYLRNASNIDLYSYRSRRVSLSLDYLLF